MELKTKDYCRFSIGDFTFNGAKFANKALPGDIVEWDGNCNLIKRNKHLLIVGTLELNSKTKYGMTKRGYPMYLFVPFDRSYPQFIVGSSHKDCSKNCIGIINFESWDEDVLPRGTLVRIVGQCGDSSAEEEAILLTYHPYKMSKTLDMAIELEKNDFIYRNHCPEQTFNIDPVGCMDIDDVLSIVGNEIWITIADVAERVSCGSAIDIFAAKQGQTVYCEGKAILPMLPYELSELRCSLCPGELKPGVTLKLICDNYGIVKVLWDLTCVKNKKSYDYDTFIEKGTADGINIQFIQRIAESILREKTNDPHKWIEAFMLKYNTEAAELLSIKERGILRKHSGPDKEKWEKYASWDKDMIVLANSAAKYCSVDDPSPNHVGIGSVYCHASSPIRRYADLFNQRILKSIIRDDSSISDVEYPVNIEWLNKRQQDSKRYERDYFFQKNLGVGELEGIVLSEKRVWIKTWKRICTWKNTLEPGSCISLKYFVNQNSRHWKDRIVFQASQN